MPIDPSQIIREFCVTSAGLRIIFRVDSYYHTLDYFLTLFNEAKKDFPGITPESVEVIHYGGECYAKTDGLEFDVAAGTVIPSNYKEISQIEFIR